MNLGFCGCGQPLWAPESQRRGFCEYCRLHHCVHWPELGCHPRVVPALRPDYDNPHWRDGTPPKPVWGINLMRGNGGLVLHRHNCSLLDGKQVPWLWANTVGLGEILYAATFFGYSTCRQCHPLASFDTTVV